MKKFLVLLFFSGVIVLFAKCRKPELFPEELMDERMSGGSQTCFDNTSQAFSHPFYGMSAYDEHIHALGDAAFEQVFVTAPAPFNSGLGGAYNNVSCVSCHHNDGIGVPTTGGPESSLLMRISFNGSDEHGGPMPVPGYGTQIQDKAVFGKQPEAKVNIIYTYQSYSFPDGQTYELRSPVYILSDLYAPINGSYMLSPRLAPPVYGLGLLEAVPDEVILQHADISDVNNDGISGKPNYVWDPLTQKTQLGRFGLKANTASVHTQVAAAYNNDMGITNSVFPLETVHGQPQGDNLTDDHELADSLLNAVKFYVQTLQVPARRNVTEPQVIQGKKVFIEGQCASCHQPNLTTAVNVAFPPVSNQTLHPYTDLLLHDMGAGLADNRPDFAANGNEWRTAPLWGVGLFETVNYPAYYLHDGRARTLIEAIMWHGGEAENSKEYVKQLSTSDRNALIKFLKSL